MTAMMEQYLTKKKENPSCLLLFRLGDFYELFFDDAIIASKDLGIALTGRNYGEAERAPMCGVPYHAADGYIAQLVEKGHKVAVCEQMESPKPGAKGPVRREVVRIITPGTITDPNMLEEGKNNYIVCLNRIKKGCALAAADITTGAFTTMLFSIDKSAEKDDSKRIIDEVARFYPAEILVDESFSHKAALEASLGIKPTTLPIWNFSADFAYKLLTTHFNTKHLEGFGLKENAKEIPAAGALLMYLQETQKGALDQITSIKPISEGGYLVMDKNTRQNLELTTTHNKHTKYTLLGVLDHTCTAMGARLLRTWIEMPLMEVEAIEKRQNAVEEWVVQSFLRAELRDSLNGMHDMERLMARLSGGGTSGGGGANGRDLAALKNSLSHLPYIKEKLWETTSDLNVSMHRNFDDLKDIYHLIESALVEEPPTTIKEGGIIKAGYNPDLDELLNIKENGETWLREMEEKERAATGIKSLKIKHNRVFGYYIEVTKANISAVPDSYIRKQTLANNERYTTPELDKLAETILNADEKRMELEYKIFESLRQEVVNNIQRVQFMAAMIAAVDGIQSLGEVADRNRYTKPTVNDGGTIYIKAGRHPVLETISNFVPNDTHLDNIKRRMMVLTGPNMAGKSTYMRQVALITLMAQMGSFVPAEEAIIGVVDRIFTRVGASDDLASGNSTFMVEMTEVAFILNHATRKSLIVMDEIGRGTSTYDGLSIAWAVLEYIADAEILGAKTLFATHYHELTVMEERMPGVRNYSFTLSESEKDSDVLFLRKLIRGGADKSYGIQVARLAGLPKTVLTRAKKVLTTLEKAGSFINTEDIEPHHAMFLNEEEDENYEQERL